MSLSAVGTAGQDGFDAFRDRVYRDPALQARLACERHPAAFVALVVATADEVGHILSTVDVVEAMRRGHIAWLTCGCEIV